MSWQAVLYFLLWAGAFALMMRFGCGAHVMGHGHGGPSSDTGSGSQGGAGAGELEKTVDPVCGMPVRKAEAKTSAYQGQVYYFCSPACREKFEAAPASFAAQGNSTTQRQEHHHGCC
jgi:YHS domain-containing protein